MTPRFRTLDSQRIADLIRAAEQFVCYAGPGEQRAPAQVKTRDDGLARSIGKCPLVPNAC